MSTDINSPTQALELAAHIVCEVGAELRGKGWIGDVINPDIPESVTWHQEYPISRTTIHYLGEVEEWARDVKSAVREVLPRHGQTIVQSSFSEAEHTFLETLETDYVKVVIESE